MYLHFQYPKYIKIKRGSMFKGNLLKGDNYGSIEHFSKFVECTSRSSSSWESSSCGCSSKFCTCGAGLGDRSTFTCACGVLFSLEFTSSGGSQVCSCGKFLPN